VCANHGDLTPGTFPTTGCANGSNVTYPVFVEGGYAPQPMNSLGANNMKTACPFFDPSEPLCCNSDTA